MIADKDKARPKRTPGRPYLPRKPKAGRFAAVSFNIPELKRPPERNKAKALAGVVAVGVIMFAIWPTVKKEEPKVDIFIVEAEMQEPPKPKPPEDPPPKPKPKLKIPKPTPPPPKQFGVQEKSTVEKSDLAVATGNTINTKADSIVKPPPPPLEPEPVQLDKPARRVSGPEPKYPPEMEARGVGAIVKVWVTIDTEGMVTNIEISKSGGKQFDEAVVKAIKMTRFIAPVVGGKKVAGKFLAPYHFEPEG